jgi:hypothetical protein
MTTKTDFSVGALVITTKTYRKAAVFVYEDKKGKVVKVLGRAKSRLYRVRFTPHNGPCPCCREGAQEISLPGSFLRSYTPDEERVWAVGTRVSAAKTIRRYQSGVKIAHRHDKGVVMEVHQRGFFLVKFDPVLTVQADGTEVFSPYRTERVSGIDLVQVINQEEVTDISSLGRKGQGKAFFDFLLQREKAKATSEDELMSRISRLRKLLSAASFFGSSPGVLVEEGFLKERELAMILEGAASDKKIMKYPWSYIPKKYQRLLLTVGTHDQAVTRVMKEDRSVSSPVSDREAEAQRRLLRATAIWGRSQRRLVRVSEASQETLFDVAVQRAALGLQVCHWDCLSAPGGTGLEFGSGVMFQWDGFQAERANHVFTFGAPKGIFLSEHLEFVSWRLVTADDRWWAEGFSHVWQIANTPYYMRRLEFEDTVSTALQRLQDEAATRGEPITRAQAAEAVLQRPEFKLVHMSINLIAALHNFHHDVVEGEKQDKARRKRSKTRNLRSVFQINLDDDGLSTWSQTWCADQAKRESQTGSQGGTGKTGLVALHKRVGHISPVWVLPKNVRFTDKVMSTKADVNGKVEYCKVERPRIACLVGKGKLKANEVRVRLGSDDIDVRTPTLALLPAEISGNEEE